MQIDFFLIMKDIFESNWFSLTVESPRELYLCENSKPNFRRCRKYGEVIFTEFSIQFSTDKQHDSNYCSIEEKQLKLET